MNYKIISIVIFLCVDVDCSCVFISIRKFGFGWTRGPFNHRHCCLCHCFSHHPFNYSLVTYVIVDHTSSNFELEICWVVSYTTVYCKWLLWNNSSVCMKNNPQFDQMLDKFVKHLTQHVQTWGVIKFIVQKVKFAGLNLTDFNF